MSILFQMPYQKNLLNIPKKEKNNFEKRWREIEWFPSDDFIEFQTHFFNVFYIIYFGRHKLSENGVKCIWVVEWRRVNKNLNGRRSVYEVFFIWLKGDFIRQWSVILRILMEFIWKFVFFSTIAIIITWKFKFIILYNQMNFGI